MKKPLQISEKLKLIFVFLVQVQAQRCLPQLWWNQLQLPPQV